MSHEAGRPSGSRLKLPMVYLTLLLSVMHICNVMAFKVIVIFGFKIALSGFLFPISFLFLLVLNESYGHQETGKTVLMVLLGQSILLSVITVASLMPSPSGVKTTQLYSALYGNLWRVLISSNIAVGLSYYFLSILNSSAKIWLLRRHKWERYFFTVGIGKGILVCVSYPINFYGLMGWPEIAQVCVNTWVFKMLISVPLMMLVPLLLRLNAHIDQTHIMDFNVSYNPIRLYSKHQGGVNFYEK